ncbi:porin family protein [Psychroserpens luteolus]|uniref:porin family protein n=1 Tax=Psychroserpens luteolus TaxID=2855840 RepID=UPI001E4BA9D3|nr:porin family protein [Psychroserpens luteolus]MCD2257630.1 porin family protein [Psychroserpens luteolus]
METKKDIGAALKSRLEPFKDSPDDLVWNTIEAKLKKKKKRRVLFLWFSGLGVALLFLMLGIVDPFHYFDKNKTIEIETVDQHQKNTSNTTKDRSSTIYNTESLSNENTHQLDHPSVVENEEVDKTNQNTVSTSPNQRKIQRPQHHLPNKQDNTLSHLNSQQDDNSIDTSKKSIGNNILPSENNKTALLTSDSKRQISEERKRRRDSVIAANKKVRDSIKMQRQSRRLVSEENTKDKDSSNLDDQSKWSITPQVTLSYYGALNTKTTDNFSVNYGVLASYRMTPKTYLRIGVRQLKLNQTIDSDGTERNVEYLEFPIEIKYRPQNNRISPYITGGLSYFKLQEDSNNSSNNFEYKATMGLNLGLGLETKLFNQIYFNLESNFNYQLKPFTQKNNIEPFIFSIHTGIEYRF